MNEEIRKQFYEEILNLWNNQQLQEFRTGILDKNIVDNPITLIDLFQRLPVASPTSFILTGEPIAYLCQLRLNQQQLHTSKTKISLLSQSINKMIRQIQILFFVDIKPFKFSIEQITYTSLSMFGLEDKSKDFFVSQRFRVPNTQDYKEFTELIKLCSYPMQCQIVNEIIDYMGIELKGIQESGKQGKIFTIDFQQIPDHIFWKIFSIVREKKVMTPELKVQTQ